MIFGFFFFLICAFLYWRKFYPSEASQEVIKRPLIEKEFLSSIKDVSETWFKFERIYCSVQRISGWDLTEKEVVRFIENWKEGKVDQAFYRLAIEENKKPLFKNAERLRKLFGDQFKELNFDAKTKRVDSFLIRHAIHSQFILRVDCFPKNTVVLETRFGSFDQLASCYQ